jgi:CTD nuclear envelope phosphatase 1
LRQIAETDKLDLSGAKEDSEPLVNEDGLPIHEIRETPDGAAIDGSLVTQANKTGASVSTEEDGDLETEMREKEKEYWSTAAVAKRKALFDRVFGGVSDSDEDEADELDAGDVGEDRAVSGTSGKSRRKGKGKARHDDSGESEDEEEERASFPLSIGARRSSSPPPIPNVDVTLPTPSSPTGASIAAGAAEDDSAASIGLGAPPGTAQSPTSSGRRTSASMPPPAKSILKPAQRKKSVSFDESVPIPPDSPDRTAGKGKMGFQLPLPIAVGDDAADHYGEKAVPTIHAPTPKNKADQGAAGGSAFAGFKRGFLNGPTSSPPSQAKSSATPSAAVTPSTSSDETKPTRKPSLFAQRMAQKAVVESPAVSPPIPPSVPEPKIKPKPALPKMSESTGTSSVKPAVVEKPPAVRETVKEAPQPEIANWTPLSQLPPNAPSGFKPGESSGLSRAGAGDNLDEDDEDDYEDHELEFDSDEEDEYDLDDALLAREMALEYHRRKMYQPRKYGSDEEDDAADDDAGAVGEDGKMDPDKLDLGGLGANGLGNVMLALPQVEGGDGPQIVNPTPDDWRRFVRVGRLENGNLVLAPGQEGWEEGDEEDGATAEAHADAGEHNGTEIIPAAQSSGSTLPPSTATANAKPGHQDESALSAEEKKANVERMKRVILGLEEDKPVKPATVSSPASQILLPPTLQKAIPDDEGASSAPPVAASARSNVAKAETKGLGDIVERSAMPAVLGVKENTGVAASDAAPPKKVSRFKAARLGA